MDDENALSRLGKMIANEVRDQVIRDWDRILDGSLKGATATKVREDLAESDGDASKAISQVLPRIVDATVHNFLWMFEENESLALKVRDRNGSEVNIAEESDGLTGELYGPNGWIARFSGERHEES